MTLPDSGPSLPTGPAHRRFLADRMLSRLARWLRVAGEDVLCAAEPGSHDPPRAELHRLARYEGRIILTRDRSFPGERSERLVLVSTDLDEQLGEFYAAFPADPLARAFTRCTACNGEARAVPRESVLAELPPAVRERGRDFRRCSRCNHLYWEGSHSLRIRARLTAVRHALQAPGQTADGRLVRAASSAPPLSPADHRGWARFDDFLRELFVRLELSWPGYRRPRRSLRAPITRRLGELGLRDYGQYLDHLTQHFDEEKKRLSAILSITISRFFRDREDWAELARVAFPELVRRARPLRAASFGCASGEEPYTLRLLWEESRAHGITGETPLRIDAFDVREDVLARVKEALYTAPSVHSVPLPLRDRWFTKEDGGYRLDPSIVASVHFTRGDFFHEPLGGPYDLILCRNVALTYLGPRRQVDILRRLIEAQAPGGFLMVGGGERLPGPPEGPEDWGVARAGRCLYQRAK